MAKFKVKVVRENLSAKGWAAGSCRASEILGTIRETDNLLAARQVADDWSITNGNEYIYAIVVPSETNEIR